MTEALQNISASKGQDKEKKELKHNTRVYPTLKMLSYNMIRKK